MHPADPSLLTIVELKALPAKPVQTFTGVFLVKKNTLRMARNGVEFSILEVGDCTGALSFNCFSDTPMFEALKELEEGAILQIEGVTAYYQDRLSPKIQTITRITEEVAASQNLLQRLVESSLENSEHLWEELQAHIECIQDPALRLTVIHVFQEVGPVFKSIPAGIYMHHAYRYGLMEHTVHVARAARALLPLYPEVHADLALAGVLVHDVGKTIEYEGHFKAKKSRKGILQGHVILGYRIIRRAALQAKLPECLLERLEHIVLSHQGELEWGAAVMAATPEAVFVSMIDHLDAKLGMVQYALRTCSETDTFSAYMPGLKTPLLVRSVTDDLES